MKILWIPHISWHIPQRAHLFCRELAARHEVHVTDWVADFATLSDYMSVRYLRNFTSRLHRDGSIQVHGIPRISPALFSSRLRRINQNIFSHHVQRIIDVYEIDVVVGTFVVRPPQAKRVIFDLFDENVAYWRRYGRVKEYADEIAEIEWLYLTTADATVAASTVLHDKAERLAPGRPTHVIPNGIDLSKYLHVDGREFRTTVGTEGKLVGIVGSHDKRNEMELVIHVAALMVDKPVTFLIAGRGTQLTWAKKKVRDLGLSNVKFYGFIPFDQLPKVMNALDVGLCPYEKTEGADASSPMRLFSYLAAEAPVVCTDLASVRALSLENIVLVRDNPPAFVNGIRQALSLPHKRPEGIIEYDLPRLAAQYEQVLEGRL